MRAIKGKSMTKVGPTNPWRCKMSLHRTLSSHKSAGLVLGLLITSCLRRSGTCFALLQQQQASIEVLRSSWWCFTDLSIPTRFPRTRVPSSTDTILKPVVTTYPNAIVINHFTPVSSSSIKALPTREDKCLSPFQLSPSSYCGPVM